jgi:putative serine/threonine protein kinase
LGLQVLKEDAQLVEVRHFIYPKYSAEIEAELRSSGLSKVYSVGPVSLGKFRALGKGKTGVVVLTEELRALKIRRTDSPKDDMNMEAFFQERAYPASPRVYSHGRNFIEMEYVEGRPLQRGEGVEVVLDLLRRAKLLDDLKIQHKEISRPWKNVLVSTRRTYVIDYDSCTFSPFPTNVSTLVSSVLGMVSEAKAYARATLSFGELMTLILRRS